MPEARYFVFKQDKEWLVVFEGRVMARHTGKKPVNIVFLDCAVRSVGLKECWTLNWSQGWVAPDITTMRWPQWMAGYQ